MVRIALESILDALQVIERRQARGIATDSCNVDFVSGTHARQCAQVLRIDVIEPLELNFGDANLEVLAYGNAVPPRDVISLGHRQGCKPRGHGPRRLLALHYGLRRPFEIRRADVS